MIPEANKDDKCNEATITDQTALILAIEDDQAILDMLRLSLQRSGYAVIGVESAIQARKTLADNHIDLALIDWMLPGGSGLELVRNLRADELTFNLPIIMLTARSDEQDVAIGLDAGADDYVTKPFSPRELNSRIKALLRRAQDFNKDKELCLGKLILNVAAHQASAGDAPIALGHTEFKLLQFLLRNVDRVYSRRQLLDHVWGRGTFIDERTVDVHILRLRKSLRPHGLDTFLQTVRGAGYRLSAAN